MKKMFTYFLAVLLGFNLCAGCTEEPVDGNGGDHADKSVNEWIFSTLEAYYLWSNQSEWINANSAPQYNQSYTTFFRSTLHQPVRPFPVDQPHDGYYYNGAWIPYSYISMSDAGSRSVSGLHSFGFEFGLWGYFEGLVFGYVLYVVPGSPADAADLHRGDWIQQVNGRDMPQESYLDIYPEMIASSGVTSVTLGLVDFTLMNMDDDYIYLRKTIGRDITLTATAVDDNPVYRSEIIETTNGAKIAYLVYNAFQRGRNPQTLEDDFNDTTYEEWLKDAFRDFEEKDATHLVLDLRYNPGGYNVTCVLLGSLIRPAESGVTSDFFVKYKSRDNLGTSGFDWPRTEDYFMTTSTSTNPPGTGVNNYPGFETVYLLVSDQTASASEMLINSLRGASSRQVDVHVIGGTTAGKNVGSSPYTKIDNGKSYTMYPIMFQNFNALEESNFANGFSPGTVTGYVDPAYVWDELYDVAVIGQAYRLKEFGAPDDPLLAKAIELISGTARTSAAHAARIGKEARSGGGNSVRLPESSLDRKPVRGSIRIIDATPAPY